MFKKLFLIASIAAITCLIPQTGKAAESQAISKSLTECTVIFQVYGLMAKDQGKPDNIVAYFNKAAARFRDAAMTQATAENVADPKQYVSDTYTDLLPKWQKKYTAITKGSMVEMTAETKDIMDWVNYCGSLGRKIKILPLEK